MMYSTILQSLTMLRVALVRTRAGESHAQYNIAMPAKKTECSAMSEGQCRNEAQVVVCREDARCVATEIEAWDSSTLVERAFERVGGQALERGTLQRLRRTRESEQQCKDRAQQHLP